MLKPTDKIRFVPAANWFGSATISYRAWDVAQGPTTGPVDVTTGAQFSVEEATALTTVIPVNDAPVLDLSASHVFTGTTAQTVASLNASGASDPDAALTTPKLDANAVDDTKLGIAVTHVSASGRRLGIQPDAR